MLSPKTFIDYLQAHNLDFYTGVPDSLLKNLCAYITDTLPHHRHIIAANEGAAVGLAAGHYIATRHIPTVYMQNSGIGNAVNPLMSLTDEDVYNIPVLLLIGWRGEPGVHDEPQHKKQGKVTIPLLDAMQIRNAVLSTDEAEALKQVEEAIAYMKETQRAFAFVVHKGTFDDYKLQNVIIRSELHLQREEAIRHIVEHIEPQAAIVSTTGMISRELFEIREARHEQHQRDFLTVGSMGHASQIALGIALEQPQRPIYCLDGDGATIMHMGSLSIVGQMQPANYTHIVLNNGAHDSVGGQPTMGLDIDLPAIATAANYKSTFTASSVEELDAILQSVVNAPKPALIEVKVKKGARKDLGRPTTTPIQNKEALMTFLNQ